VGHPSCVQWLRTAAEDRWAVLSLSADMFLRGQVSALLLLGSAVLKSSCTQRAASVSLHCASACNGHRRLLMARAGGQTASSSRGHVLARSAAAGRSAVARIVLRCAQLCTMVGVVVAVSRGVHGAELIGRSLAKYRTHADMLSLPRAPRFAQVGHLHPTTAPAPLT